MRPRIALFACALAATGCPTGGYQILAGSPSAATMSPRPQVTLYGIEGAGEPPADCIILGTVRAWSRGEITFPYGPLRSAAEALGGDSVFGIQDDSSFTDRKRPTHIATVARCRR